MGSTDLAIHIETAASDTDENWDREVTTVVTECGLSCTIGDDGEPQPPLDFCSREHAADVATCDECRAAMGFSSGN